MFRLNKLDDTSIPLSGLALGSHNAWLISNATTQCTFIRSGRHTKGVLFTSGRGSKSRTIGSISIIQQLSSAGYVEVFNNIVATELTVCVQLKFEKRKIFEMICINLTNITSFYRMKSLPWLRILHAFAFGRNYGRYTTNYKEATLFYAGEATQDVMVIHSSPANLARQARTIPHSYAFPQPTGVNNNESRFGLRFVFVAAGAEILCWGVFCGRFFWVEEFVARLIKQNYLFADKKS